MRKLQLRSKLKCMKEKAKHKLSFFISEVQYELLIDVYIDKNIVKTIPILYNLKGLFRKFLFFNGGIDYEI